MKQKGFTLIEVMIVLSIIGILVTIAVPSYQEYLVKSRRVDAKDALVALQFAQEKYRGNNLEYAASLAAIKVPATSSQGYYTIAIVSAAGAAYEAIAKPTGVQEKTDAGCELTVTQSGFKTSTCMGIK